MSKYCRYIMVSVLLVSGMTYSSSAAQEWTSLFNGKDLTGWKISSSTGHGKGGKWEIIEGAIVGDQDAPGSGGILLTEKEYGDFVLEMEINPDYGIDSGIFVRSSEDGKCYQVMVDYRDNGNVGGIYGEAIGGFSSAFPDYEKYYKKGEWNKIKIRVKGNPPKITVWLNGQKFEYQGDNAEIRPAKGYIALQVHGGNGWPEGLKTRFRNIRIRELNSPPQ